LSEAKNHNGKESKTSRFLPPGVGGGGGDKLEENGLKYEKREQREDKKEV
jgi:hypothetical protein